MDLSALNNVQINPTGSGVLATGFKEHFQLEKTEEGSPVSLAQPGIANLAIASSPFAEVWTVVERLPQVENAAGELLDFDKDIGGVGQPKAQPAELKLNLSAMDLGTVIKQRKRQAGAPEKAKTGKEKAEETASPKPKKKKTSTQ